MMEGGAALAERPDDVTADKGPWPLPEGWCWTTLESVLPIQYGKSLPERERTPEGEFPVYGSSGRVGSHNKSIAPAKSIMVGRKGSAGSVSFSQEPSWPIDTAYFTSGSAPIDICYGFWFLHFRQLHRLDQSTAIPSLSRDIYNVQPIPLAPLAEQHRIVARIEELFAEIAEGEAALAAARKDLDTFRRALLKAAVTGELTKDWRAANPVGETGHDFLARIKQHRVAYSARKDRSRAMGSTSDPDAPTLGALPEDWAWTTLEAIGHPSRSSAYGVLQPGPNVADGIPMIRVQDIGFGVVAPDSIKRISPSIECQYKRTRLEGGEILITLVGTIGRTAVAPTELKGANTARAVGVVPLSPLVDARWIDLWLRSPPQQNELVSKAHEVARKTLNLEDVRRAAVALPPPTETAEIIRRVSEALASAADTLVLLDAEAADAARLKQSILKAAFEGRLVPQDPADEPASALLPRMSANTPTPRGKRGRTRRLPA